MSIKNSWSSQFMYEDCVWLTIHPGLNIIQNWLPDCLIPLYTNYLGDDVVPLLSHGAQRGEHTSCSDTLVERLSRPKKCNHCTSQRSQENKIPYKQCVKYFLVTDSYQKRNFIELIFLTNFVAHSLSIKQWNLTHLYHYLYTTHSWVGCDYLSILTWLCF